MAAGMGSRYGGLKQIDPIDKWLQVNSWGAIRLNRASSLRLKAF